MNRINQFLFERAKKEAGHALLHSTIEFLARNGIPQSQISAQLNENDGEVSAARRRSAFRTLSRAYENMGSVLSTWYDSSRFLNSDGSPAPISIGPGPRSLRALLQKSHVKIATADAIELFKRSPSVEFDGKNNILALRRVFVLPDFDLTRAAIVVPRYMDTLLSNKVAYRTGTVKLFERQCSASNMDLESSAPILRNIKEQGAAFVDSIDEQLEGLSEERRRRSSESELGLVVFAWTSTETRRRTKPRARMKKSRGR